MAHGTTWGNVKNPFALTIGIDTYPHATKLKGAAADADRFESFLRSKVKVNDDRIMSLRNQGATRAEIVKAICSLWKNKDIQQDDSIIIYFAGHGCKIRRPTGWEAGGREEIEGIFPYDVQESDTGSVFPIPDRSIGAWLNILSHEKGNNITVIFDCCHSASGARAPGSELVRAEEFNGSIPEGTDKETFDVVVPPEFLYQNSRSHVFLAACGATEYAREQDGRGKFTEELLKNLEGPGIGQLSFIEFMKLLKRIPKQTPQCEGHFKNRILFSNVMKLGWGVFSVIPVPTNSENKSNEETYRIDAGSIHSVDKNSLFDVYETAAIDAETTKPFCRLRIQKLHSLHAIAVIERRGEGNTIRPGFARQVCSGKPLRVHLSTTFLDVVSKHDVLHHADIDGRVDVVGDVRNADFTVDIKENNVVFGTNIKHVADYGFRMFPETVPAAPEHVARVLRAASQWKQHLEISTSAPWTSKIHTEVIPLERTSDEMGCLVFDRKGTSPLNNKDNIVYLRIPPDSNDFYGMAIRNETRLDLHVTVVVFDIDTLRIESWFSGAIGVNSGEADAYLPSGKHLTIGYGNSGGTPFQFGLPETGCSVTVLKVYFTTIPMDLGWLGQESPFPDAKSRAAKGRDEVRKLMETPDPQGATTLVTIVQLPHLS